MSEMEYTLDRKKLQENKPLVSILMTTYNCKEQLQKTLENVSSQDYPRLEIVIADGGSGDGTVDIIRSFEEELNNRKSKHPCELALKWISEPDKGIYDGLNKAYRLSSGDIIAICNDRYTRTDAVSLFVQRLLGTEFELKKQKNEDLQLTGVHADLVYMEGNVCKRLWRMGEGNIHFGWLPAHPTLFLRRQVYERYGLYDISYKSSSDYDFMLRILKDKKVILGYIPQVMIRMDYGGTSNGGGGLGYLRNVWEAYLALLHNKISFPITAIMCRIVRTVCQYNKAKHYNFNQRN